MSHEYSTKAPMIRNDNFTTKPIINIVQHGLLRGEHILSFRLILFFCKYTYLIQDIIKNAILPSIRNNIVPFLHNHDVNIYEFRHLLPHTHTLCFTPFILTCLSDLYYTLYILLPLSELLWPFVVAANLVMFEIFLFLHTHLVYQIKLN